MQENTDKVKKTPIEKSVFKYETETWNHILETDISLLEYGPKKREITFK
jgi:hypothetical protein